MNLETVHNIFTHMYFAQKDGHHGDHLGYWNGRILAILNLHVPNAYHQVWAQSGLAFGSRCGLKIFIRMQRFQQF